MTSGPGTIIISQVTDTFYTIKFSDLERTVLLRETALGVRFPPRVSRWSVWLCVFVGGPPSCERWSLDSTAQR